MLRAIENRFVFRPVRHTRGWQEPPPHIRARDVDFASADGTPLHAWWCPTEGWQPSHGALLECHGHAGNLSIHGKGIARIQQRLGEAVLIFDYPGYGRSGGRPSEEGCYAAAEAAFDWLVEKQGVPAERVLLYGGSLGGGVATEIATRRPHRALILINTVTSIPDVAQALYPWLPVRWFVRNRFDNLAKIGRVRGPVFLAHATHDRTVPPAMGERLLAAANEPKQFFPMAGLDHFHSPTPEFYTALRAFLERAAPKQEPDAPSFV